jgi:hypothetical protein
MRKLISLSLSLSEDEGTFDTSFLHLLPLSLLFSGLVLQKEQRLRLNLLNSREPPPPHPPYEYESHPKSFLSAHGSILWLRNGSPS